MTIAQRKSTRVDDVYHLLKAELRANRMPAGFMATESEIAEQFGMSRTPVREALIRLAAEGLVELIPRRGMRVVPLSPADMREIYEILTLMEPEAAANLARQRPDRATLAPLIDATDRMEQSLQTQDLDAWADADDAFHLALLGLNGNRRLRAFAEHLYDQAHRARKVTLRLRALPVQSTAEHRAILDHLLAGAPDAARDAFRAHRERTGAELLAILETLSFARF